jgi:Fic family protein
MRVPASPKSFTQLFKEVDLKQFIQLNIDSQDPKHPMGALQQRWLGDYLHWNEAKRKDLPQGISHELAWTVQKMLRLTNRAFLPLVGTDSRPFSFTYQSSLGGLLHQMDQMAGGSLVGTAALDNSTLGNLKDEFVINSLVEESIATAQIEGANTTRARAKELLLKKQTPKDKSQQMIVNGYQTMQKIKEQKGQDLSLELLLEWQESMTKGTIEPSLVGRIRKKEDETVVASSDNEVVFTPPPAESLQQRLQLMMDYANKKPEAIGNDPDFVHPIIKASVLHFWLAYEHPFPDGNGRVARTLFYWYLMKHNYWLIEYTSVSRAIFETRMQYYRAFLNAETDENDLNYFVHYIVRATHRSVVDLFQRVSDRVVQKDKARAMSLSLAHLNERQRELLIQIKNTPNVPIKIEDHQANTQVSYATARADLLGLESAGYLKRTKSGNQFVFIPLKEPLEKLS